MTPRIQTGLIETPSPAAENDAPKAATVLVVGSAGQGPTSPRVITSPKDAFATYGAEGKLAQTIELVLQGAKMGAQLAGNGVYGRVLALRTETGNKASTTLVDTSDAAVMRIVAREASEIANNFKVTPLSAGALQGFSIYDPTEGEEGVTVDFAVDFSGVDSTLISSPTELAEAIRNRFAGKLEVEVFLDRAHFEIEVSDSTVDSDGDPLVSYSSKGKLSLDPRALALVDAQALQTSANLWIDKAESNALTAEVYNRILAQDNDDARFYAITAGKAVAAPKGAQKVSMPGIAPGRVIGPDGVASLINIRDTGVGEAAEVPFAAATERAGTKVSEGFYRARKDAVGRFNASTMETTFDIDGDATPEAAYAIPFEAAYAISDDDTYTIASTYAALQSTSMTAAEASADRMGNKLANVLHLYGRELAGSIIDEIELDWSADGSGTGVHAGLDWDDSTGIATLYLNKADYDALESTAFEDGEMFVSYDSCVFDLTEKRPSALDPTATGLEYSVTGDEVKFNQPLEHELVIRPMTIQHYRLEDSLSITRTAEGNVFHFLGNTLPGEAGLPMGVDETNGTKSTMTSILGFDFNYEPNFPDIDLVVDGAAYFTGGTSGANATATERASALERALAVYKDVEHAFVVTPDLHVDTAKTAYDSQTGERIEQPAGLIDIMKRHQARVSATGAAGIVYCSLEPMKPSAATGRFSDAQKEARFVEATVVDADDPLRPATILSNAGSLPDFFVFDAPIEVSVQNKVLLVDGAPFFAGMRSALPHDHALYTKTIPDSLLRPLYRYDVVNIDMPSLLSEARINVWSSRRGDTKLADERTAAGLVPDARGNLVPSSFQSGPALLSAKEFLQRATNRLNNLLGPLPQGGIDVLRGTTVTELRSVAGSVVGIQGMDIDDQADIEIRATGGSTLGMYITVLLLVNGELRTIDLRVGVMTELDAPSSSNTTIPLAA